MIKKYEDSDPRKELEETFSVSQLFCLKQKSFTVNFLVNILLICEWFVSQIFDRNRDGYITAEEFQSAMASLGETVDKRRGKTCTILLMQHLLENNRGVGT